MSNRHDPARRDLLTDLSEGQQAGEMGERLLGLLNKLIDYEKEFLQTLEGVRAWLLASLAGTTSPQEMYEELLRLHEGFREFLRTRGLEGETPPLTNLTEGLRHEGLGRQPARVQCLKACGGIWARL